jgi:hypothetical protein
VNDDIQKKPPHPALSQREREKITEREALEVDGLRHDFRP